MHNRRKNVKRRPCLGRFLAGFILVLGAIVAVAQAQTDCGNGDSVLDTSPPKGIAPQELIQKFTAQETRVQEARSHYTYAQDVLVQTLSGKTVNGQFHQITQISYDDKGKRLEKVTYSEQPTLQGIQLTPEDMDDIRVFMQWILTTEELPEYTVTYAGQQHLDDLDTYAFHVVPKKEEKNKRYFEGRIWVDNRDLQIVKLCGKSVAEAQHRKKNEPVDVRPTFAGYRQLVDGYWFPAYARVDETLNLGVDSVHVREIVKLMHYKRITGAAAAAQP